MNRAILISTACVAAFATPAAAVNWQAFKNAPFTRMSAIDAAAFKAVIVQTLERGKDGQTVNWSGEEQGVQSELTPMKSYQVDGRPCRDIRIDTVAKALSAQGVYSLCKSDSGDWKFQSQPRAAASEK